MLEKKGGEGYVRNSFIINVIYYTVKLNFLSFVVSNVLEIFI